VPDVTSDLSGHDLRERSATQAGEVSGQATQALATADHVHACTFIVRTHRIVKIAKVCAMCGGLLLMVIHINFTKVISDAGTDSRGANP